MTAVELFLRRLRLRGLTSSKNVFCKKIHPFTAIWFWNFAWILGTKILKYCSSFRVNVWLHVSSITSVLLHIIIEWVLYKYKAATNTIFLCIILVFLSVATRFKILSAETISLKNASGKNLKNVLLTSRFYRDSQSLVWLWHCIRTQQRCI